MDIYWTIEPDGTKHIVTDDGREIITRRELLQETRWLRDILTWLKRCLAKNNAKARNIYDLYTLAVILRMFDLADFLIVENDLDPSLKKKLIQELILLFNEVPENQKEEFLAKEAHHLVLALFKTFKLPIGEETTVLNYEKLERYYYYWLQRKELTLEDFKKLGIEYIPIDKT